VSAEQIKELYNEMTGGIEGPVELEVMNRLSKAMSIDAEEYRHSELQAVIAAIILSVKSEFVIVISPTGSGKTWV